MTRWKYLLVAVVLVSRLVALSLCYVSDISDWCWYLFTGGWFVLLFLTMWSLLRLRWRELAIFALALVVTASPAFRVGKSLLPGSRKACFVSMPYIASARCLSISFYRRASWSIMPRAMGLKGKSANAMDFVRLSGFDPA